MGDRPMRMVRWGIRDPMGGIGQLPYGRGREGASGRE